jgi:hypothetical protein
MGDPIDIFDYLYAELPPYLEEQREALRQFLETQQHRDTGKETDHARTNDD